MTGALRCYSFHSVKGGVGKSTLSTFLALGLARRHPEAQVVLIDLDLTGMSTPVEIRGAAPMCGQRMRIGPLVKFSANAGGSGRGGVAAKR